MVTALVTAAACAVGALHRAPDFDEIEHLHAGWLVAKGLKPFHDFFECHPPFFWYLLPGFGVQIPPARLLIISRGAAAAVSLAFLAVLLLHAVRTHREQVWWAVLGVLFVVSSRANLEYLFEYRPDNLSYVLLFAGLLILRKNRPPASQPARAAAGMLIAASLLLSLKLLPFLLLLFVCDATASVRAVGRRGWRELVPRVLIPLLPGGAVLAGGVVFLRGAGVDPHLAYRFVVEYHRILMREFGMNFGLLHALLSQLPQLVLLLLAIACGVCMRLRGRGTLDRYHGAILGFLIYTAVAVPFPYKQYFTPWLLLAAGFCVCLPSCLRLVSPRAPNTVMLAVALLSGLQAALTLRGHLSLTEMAEFRTLYALTTRPPVAVPPPFHPITEHDLFYAWVYSNDAHGNATERIMQQMAVQPYSSFFTETHYDAVLREHEPGVLLQEDGRFSHYPAQHRSLARFIEGHANEYRRFDLLGRTVWVRDRVGNAELMREPGRPLEAAGAGKDS